MMTKRNTSKPKASHKSLRSNGAPIDRRRVMFTLGAIAAIGGGGALFIYSQPTMAEEVVVYKDPSCQCCDRWASHMRQNGFTVVVNGIEDMDTIKRKAGIPEAMVSCHTAFVGRYLVEGHVPAADIKRLLAERLAVKGLAVPGMPNSAPGMDSPTGEPYTVFAFDAKGATSVFTSY